MSIEVGSILEGVVTGITKFGAFIELPEGKTGLVHISEVADDYVVDVHDFITEQEKVKVKVLSIDDRGKIGLSIKQVEGNKPKEKLPAATADSESSVSAQPMRPQRDVRRGAAVKQMGSPSFEDKLSRFLKDSDERLTDFKRRTDSKRGGRGSRRS